MHVRFSTGEILLMASPSVLGYFSPVAVWYPNNIIATTAQLSLFTATQTQSHPSRLFFGTG
jgi:hypothetical protein